ncbi:MAG: EpsD family peptidyl-prolyl cis-trans isomerase [Alphaproteobacteria bacterium]
MNKHIRWPAALIFAACAALAGCSKGDKAAKAAGKDGESQVIARVGGEEITVHQLNAELSTVPGMAVQDPKELQRAVLRAIVFRTAMRQAAVKDKIDRDPQISLLKKAAVDKLLADTYLKRQTGTTPPPTSAEVDQFIVEHPLQFDDRRMYQFTRVTIPADKYSDLMVPLFDEKPSFAELEAYLNEKSINYSSTDVRVASSDFPKDVQAQLVHFKVGDNVVVRGPQSIVILKIKSWVAAPVPRDQSREIAQNTLYQQSIQKRALSIQEALPATTKLEFMGPFAGMQFIEKQAEPAKPEQPGAPTPNTNGGGTNPAAPANTAPAQPVNPGQGGGQ